MEIGPKTGVYGNWGVQKHKNSIENPYEFNLIWFFNSLFDALKALRKHSNSNTKTLVNPHGSSESSQILMGLIMPEQIMASQ
jgi:hypothetical protein